MALLAVLTVMLNSPVSAEKTVTDVFFDASKARLLAEGYHNVRMRNDYPLNLSARDSDGRKVSFIVDGVTGVIGSPKYDYSVDEADNVVE